MRRETDVFIGCELSPRERAAADDMKRSIGLTTDANLLRTALYRLATHLDVRTDATLFCLRSGVPRLCDDGKHRKKAVAMRRRA